MIHGYKVAAVFVFLAVVVIFSALGYTQPYRGFADVQPQYTYWAKSYGGNDVDAGSCIQQTADGGFVVVGNTYSFGSGFSDFWVIKMNSDGSIVWEKCYGMAKDEHAYCIQQTSDGGYIVAGGTNSTGLGSADVWILKLDENGNILWEKSYGGSGYDYAYYIAQTSDSGYIVAGTTDSFGAGNDDVLIMKLSENGTVEWQKTYGGNDYEWVGNIVETSDGGYIFCGGGYFSNGAGLCDAWVVKLSSNGDIVWQKIYGGSDYDSAMYILPTSDGGYVVSGYTCSFGQGEEDIWILKLDSNGDIIWQKTYGDSGSNVQTFTPLERTSDGGYVVSGVFGNDIWIVKLDSNGDVVWQKKYGGTQWDEPAFITETLDGGFILTGYATSFGINGELWVLKVGSDGEIVFDSGSGAFVQNTSVVPANTSVSPVSTSFTTGNSSLTVQNTNAVVQRTSAVVRVQATPTILPEMDTLFVITALIIFGIFFNSSKKLNI